MMKKKYLATILMICVILCSVLCGCSTSLSYADSDRYSAGNTTIEEAVSSIRLSWVKGSVSIAYHDENTITLEETASKTLSEKNKVHWYLDGGTLRIHFAAAGKFYFENLSKKLTLTLPKGFRADEISVSLASATLKTEELSANEISVATASGDVSLAAEAKKIEISTASGKIDLAQKGKCGEIDLNAASGDVEAELDTAEEFESESASGKLELTAQTLDKVDINTASGQVTMTVKNTLKSCDIDCASGNVKMFLPQDLGFTLRAKPVSGDFSSTFPMVKNGNRYTVGNGEADIEISTASGDIEVSPLS